MAPIVVWGAGGDTDRRLQWPTAAIFRLRSLPVADHDFLVAVSGSS